MTDSPDYTMYNGSHNERKLVRAYRKLSSADQKNVILAVNAWVNKDEPR